MQARELALECICLVSKDGKSVCLLPPRKGSFVSCRRMVDFISTYQARQECQLSFHCQPTGTILCLWCISHKQLEPNASSMA